ncbi:MAG: hypothetical protein GVY36_18885 [Verrucomicrobia bacterium]|jgi:catechol 2,3-dioxygenase-like lactoylglutathione lyase family enzyme|nr:hypothetical protein [Verrucomicrobiota bacterium]
MANHLHHVHIFASDLDYSKAFYQKVFDAEVMLDREFAGARNVFMAIGQGRLHLYDQIGAVSIISAYRPMNSTRFRIGWLLSALNSIKAFGITACGVI